MLVVNLYNNSEEESTLYGHGSWIYTPLCSYYTEDIRIDYDKLVDNYTNSDLYILVGLPGSGKTELLKRIKEFDIGDKYYDIFKVNNLNIYLYSNVIIIDDPDYLDMNIFYKKYDKKTTIFLADSSFTSTDYELGGKYLFFKNDLEQCIKNLKRRETDKERLDKLIKRTKELSALYTHEFRKNLSPHSYNNYYKCSEIDVYKEE